MENQEQFDYSPDLYTLIDEEGNEQAFELLDMMEVDGSRYYALLPFYEDPSEALEDDGQLVVLKGEEIDGEEMMASIDNDEEFDRIGNLFLEKLSDLFEAEFEEAEEE